MDFWREPRQAIAGVFIGAAFIAGVLAGYGTFETYAGGWGSQLCAATGVLFFVISGLVKE